MLLASDQRDTVYEVLEDRPRPHAAGQSGPLSLIDLLLESTRLPSAGEVASTATDVRVKVKRSAAVLDEFLAMESPAESLAFYLRLATQGGERLDAEQAMLLFARDIARIDELLSEQVNAILHSPQFQQLEAAWRGLRYLVDQLEEGREIEVRILNVSKRELMKDLDRALEFDQSQFFKKVYEEEFGTPGGTPYGLLVGNYEFGPGADDMAMLTKISCVAASAFAPFIAGISPSMLGLDHFGTIEYASNPAKIFEQIEYLKWKAFRDSEDSRFVGLTLPHVLARLPYDDDGSRTDNFRFSEEVGKPGGENYLWANAAFAFAAVVVRSFSLSGWMADIRGVERGKERGGIITGLPVHSFSTDPTGIAMKSSTDVVIADFAEPMLSDLGFIPLCHCKDSEYVAFCSAQSVQKPKKYDTVDATTNSRISSMLQYLLCVSRFAHALKVIGRNRIGSFTEPQECEDLLHSWLQNYVTPDASASAETKAEHPLRKAEVHVRRHPTDSGSYLSTISLWPHFELDELVGTLTIRTELRSPNK